MCCPHLASFRSLVLEAMDSDEPIEDAHLKQMVRIFNEAVASGALQPLKIVGKRVDARAYQISGAVRKIALVQLFRTLNTAVLPEKLVETGLMVIVGTSTTARDCCLHAINHLIRPTGFLSYKMLYNDTMIVVEGKSIDKWRSTRRMFNALHKHEQAPSNTLVEDGLSPAILRM